MKDRLLRTEVEFFLSLAAGDKVEVQEPPGGIYSVGTVQTAAPELGLISIHDRLGKHKVVNIFEDSIRPATTYPAGPN